MSQHPSSDERTAEYLKSQLQQDAKLDDFPFICLSRRESKLLRAANSSSDGWAKADGKNYAAAQRLADLSMARFLRNDRPNGETRFFCEIRPRGKNYLLYLKNSRRQNRVESIRYWITTVIAVIALLKSFSQELSAGLAWLLKLIEP